MLNLSIPASGLNDANLRMFAVSHNVANLNTPAPVTINEVISETVPNGQGVSSTIVTRESVFGVDLVTEAVNLKLAENAYLANARVLASADDVLGTIIDMFDPGPSDHN